MAKNRREPSGRERRRLRVQQIIFALIALMIVCVMVVGLFANSF